MNNAYLNFLRTSAIAELTHLGLVDDDGTELTGSGYIRLAVTWATDGDGVMRPNADLTFNVPIGKVGGWRAYTAEEHGTDYGGYDFAEELQEEYLAPGEFKLKHEAVGIIHEVKSE